MMLVMRCYSCGEIVRQNALVYKLPYYSNRDTLFINFNVITAGISKEILLIPVETLQHSTT